MSTKKQITRAKFRMAQGNGRVFHTRPVVTLPGSTPSKTAGIRRWDRLDPPRWKSAVAEFRMIPNYLPSATTPTPTPTPRKPASSFDGEKTPRALQEHDNIKNVHAARREPPL